MDPIVLALIAIVALFVLIALHVPIGISMAAVGVTGFACLSTFNAATSLLASETITAISNLDIAVLPLFVLLGNFANAAGISEDFYNLAQAVFGRWRGGLAMATVVGNGLFGTICGSSFAATATFGKIALPQMRKRGYGLALTSGSIAAGGTLSSLVPPSIILVIYSVMTETSIIDLFVAAIGPAILTIGLYLLSIIGYVRLYPASSPETESTNVSDIWKLVCKSWTAFLLMFIVAGGIYGGILTVNEAASLGAIAAFLIAVFGKKMTLPVFWHTLVDTASTTAMLYMLMIGAYVLNYFVVLTHAPEVLTVAVTESGLSVFMIFFLMLIVYLILGSIFDTIAAMLITLPFVVPIIQGMGYSLIWWGIMNVIIIEIGLISPPIGMNVFILHGMFREIPLITIFKGIIPFLIAAIVSLILMMIFPSISTWLPTLLQK